MTCPARYARSTGEDPVGGHRVPEARDDSCNNGPADGSPSAFVPLSPSSLLHLSDRAARARAIVVAVQTRWLVLVGGMTTVAPRAPATS